MTHVKAIAILTAIFSTIHLPALCQSSNLLDSQTFFKHINSKKNILLVDVRTPEEAKAGYIEGATIINWKDGSFKSFAQETDQEEKIYLYCRSGNRSGKAASLLRDSLGFSNVFELKGGLIQWGKDSLPVLKNNAGESPLTLETYNKLINTGKSTLVNFHAGWCGPCKKMEPFIKELEKEMEGTLKVVRIDADKNKSLIKELGVKDLPALFFYDTTGEVKKHTGFLGKKKLERFVGL